MTTFKGYDKAFLGRDAIVDLPEFPEAQLERLTYLTDRSSYVIPYAHYSVVMDKYRAFPILTAANIDGSTFESIGRKVIFDGKGDQWQKDERIPQDAQWGRELYKADKSDFDRGHMTKREDVQWGDTVEEAKEAARSTFYYTNAVPQHARVNQSIWRRIEDYILKKETVAHDLKVNVLTGPVLRDEDPVFVTPVNGNRVQLPILFWKVIYYRSADNPLCRVAFLVGQKYLLEKHGIVKRTYRKRARRERFMNFKEADTYQVDMSIIEELTDWTFHAAHDPFVDDRPSKLVIQKTQVKRGHNNAVVAEDVLKGLVL